MPNVPSSPEHAVHVAEDPRRGPPAAPRRRFLKVLAGGGALAGAASLGVGCTVKTASLDGQPVDGGNVSALSVGSLIALSSEPVAVGRDAQGVYAMTLVCTHQGCEITSVTPQGLTCPCHGSTYDVNGNVTRGPAPAPLDHLAVTLSASGEITVDTATVVSASTRTPVTG